MVRHATTAVMVWGTEAPAHSIGHEEPMWPGDSGFTVLFDDAPGPDEVQPGDPRISLVCLHCLIDGHPELGRGLDLAREHGVADLDENDEWIVGDISRLARGSYAKSSGSVSRSSLRAEP